MDEKTAFAEACERIEAQKLPRWEALPDFELYMDQVLSLIGRYLGSYPGFDRKGLTASMVNNYVKLGVMPPPAKKKYTRVHLAHLIMICVLKASLPMDAIRALLAASAASDDVSVCYDRFCGQFEQAGASAADAAKSGPENDELSPVYCAALRAQAEQALSRSLCAALCSGEREKK